MKKPTISVEDYKKIEEEALTALDILESPKFEFVRTWLKSAQDYAQDSILNNTVREVQEVIPISEKITRIFRLPKKIQVDELIGQYKLIKKFFDDMEQFKRNKQDLDDAIARGVVEYEGRKDIR